jgi:tetratricopeptide (TPR) repeat protein
LPEQLEVSRRRLALSQDPRFSDLYKRAFILESLSDALMAVGNYAEAMHYLQEKEGLAIQIRNISSQVWALSLQALCLFRLDRWEEIFRLEDKLRELERQYAGDQLLSGGNCVVISISAAARALQGNLDQARVMREEAYAIMAEKSAGRLPENWSRTQYY